MSDTAPSSPAPNSTLATIQLVVDGLATVGAPLAGPLAPLVIGADRLVSITLNAIDRYNQAQADAATTGTQIPVTREEWLKQELSSALADDFDQVMKNARAKAAIWAASQSPTATGQ